MVNRILVLGSRTWEVPGIVYDYLVSYEGTDTTILCGDDDKGMDAYARWAAKALRLPVEVCEFEWCIPGPPDQGHQKNCNLLDQLPTRVVIFHPKLNSSPNLLLCIEECKKREIPVEVVSR